MMDTWREVSIANLAHGGSSGVAGGPFGSSLGRKHYVPAGVPVIRGAQLAGSSRFSLDGLVFVSGEKADRHVGNLARSGDVIVTQRGTLGQVGLIPPDQPYERFLLSQSQMKISVDAKVADSEFLYFLLSAPAIKRRLVGHGMTAGVPHLNLVTLRNFQVFIPDVPIQRRIAAILSAFDELIEINQRRIELLEDLARSLYREWFVHFRFPGHEDAELIDSELGPVPEGWTLAAAAEMLDVNPRISSRQASYAKVTMADVDERFSYVLPSKETDRPSGSRFGRGDVLFARITPCLENGKTALALFLAADEVGIGSTEFIVLRGVRVGPAFVYCAARSDQFREHAIKSMSGASGRQRVASDCFDSLLMVEPTAAIASRFENVAGPMLEAVFDIRVHSAQLAATRDLLLPRLVSGRLDISDIDLGVLTPLELE